MAEQQVSTLKAKGSTPFTRPMKTYVGRSPGSPCPTCGSPLAVMFTSVYCDQCPDLRTMQWRKVSLMKGSDRHVGYDAEIPFREGLIYLRVVDRPKDPLILQVRWRSPKGRWRLLTYRKANTDCIDEAKDQMTVSLLPWSQNAIVHEGYLNI